MTRRPTIADVAARAGVSKGLVSFALNDRPGVAEETKQRILTVAREMGWRPHLPARSLSTRTSYALGLVLARRPEIVGADPFFPSFIAGVETELAPQRRVLVLSMVADLAAEITTYRALAEDRRVDGVFLTDLRPGDERIPLLRELGLPAVTLGRPEGASPFPAVVVDDRPGIRAAVDHLAGLGHRRIAHVAGPPDLLHGARRSASFRAAARAHGLADDLVVETDFSAAEGAAATRRLLTAETPPTAVVYANDPMAIAGLGVARRAGLRVPEDLSITGFDDSDIGAFVHPGLTTVATGTAEWGRVAARTLLALHADGRAPDVELDPAHLVVRESTAPPPH